MEQSYNELKQGEKGAWLSIAAYIVLSGVKLLVGVLTGSAALLADGLNNATDIAASAAVLIGLRISRKPPDADHRYGHYRAQTVAALIASFIICAVGLQVLYQSAASFTQPGEIVAPGMTAAWTALVCAAAIYGVYRYNLRLSARINNAALRAAALDNRSDALVGIGAFVGITGAQFGLPWLDPLTALIVGVVICRTAWDIFRDAAHSLTDGFDASELKRIRRTIRETSGVKNIVDIRARVHGNNKLVDVTIGVDSALNVQESHDITELVERRVYDTHQISHIHIHIEPYEPLGQLGGKR